MPGGLEYFGRVYGHGNRGNVDNVRGYARAVNNDFRAGQRGDVGDFHGDAFPRRGVFNGKIRVGAAGEVYVAAPALGQGEGQNAGGRVITVGGVYKPDICEIEIIVRAQGQAMRAGELDGEQIGFAQGVVLPAGGVQQLKTIMHIARAVFNDVRGAQRLPLGVGMHVHAIGQHNAGVSGFRAGLVRVVVGGVAGRGRRPAVILGVGVVHDGDRAGFAAAHGVAAGFQHRVSEGSVGVNVVIGHDRHAEAHHQAAGRNIKADLPVAQILNQAGHFRAIGHEHQPARRIGIVHAHDRRAANTKHQRQGGCGGGVELHMDERAIRVALQNHVFIQVLRPGAQADVHKPGVVFVRRGLGVVVRPRGGSRP